MVDAVAIAEIHRHVEQVVDIALVAEAVLEDEIEHAGAIGIGIGPDVRAVAQVAVRLAVGERRIGEQRGGDRLQRERGAELAHHVRLVGEIEIDLHGAGARHHVEAEVADGRHVAAHDRVAALRHPRHVLASPFRLEAHAEEADAEFVGDGLHFLQVGMHLGSRSGGCFPAARPRVRAGRPAPGSPKRPRAAGRSACPSRSRAASRSGSGLRAGRRCPASLPRSAGAGRRDGNRTSRARCRCASRSRACRPAAM